MKNTFRPEDFCFTKLDLQNGSLCFYEYQSGLFCDGRINRHRINVYLTQDTDFVTVWHGLFDPSLIDQEFIDLVTDAGLPDFDFAENYNTSLFRGYIEDSEQAKIILKSLRYDTFMPNLLRIDEEKRLTCDTI